MDADLGKGEVCKTGFTLRAFIVGTLLCLFISTSTIYANTIISGTFMAWAFSNPVALFLLFYLIIGNVLLGFMRGKWTLAPQELVLIYLMMLVSASLPTFGLVEHLLPMMTAVFYYATPENNWAELIQPHVPGWIAPRSQAAIRDFYEGMPRDSSIPWGDWIESLSYWTIFLLALHLVSVCLMVMVRKQWVEEERLLYPMMHAPMEMVGRDAGRAGRRAEFANVFRKPQMWVGFALPVLVGSLNALHNYYPFLPSASLSFALSAFRDTIHIPVAFSFSLTGFSYFIGRDLAAGIWVFYLLALIEQGIFNTLGIQSSEKLGWFSNPKAPYLTHQALGAMLMFALFTLWKARFHLQRVWGKAFQRWDDVSDSSEIMSYKTAVRGMLLGLLVMGIWLHASGMPAVAVALLLVVALLIFFALSRIVVEAGVALVRAPLIAPDFVMASLGTSRLGAAGLTSLAYAYPWTGDIVTFPMASVANGLKMADVLIKGSKRALFWAFMLASFVTLLGAFWVMLYLSYNYGGINLNSWWWQTSCRFGLDYISQMIRSPSTTDAGGWFFTGLGASIMWVLMLVQQRVLWWPVHPLGLAMSGTVFTSGVMWFNVFLAWLIKGVVLKYGGGRLYRQTRFFFIGMILGAFVVSGSWLVIDYFTGKQGNFVLVW